MNAGGIPSPFPFPPRPVLELPTGNLNVSAKLAFPRSEDAGRRYEGGECLAFDFTSRIFAAGEGWTFAPAVRGEFAQVKLEQGRDAFQASGDYLFEIPNGDCCETLEFIELQLVPDGSGFRGTGRARLSTESCGGDTYSDPEVDVTLSGSLDLIAPTLALPSTPLHPLLPFTVQASEPLSYESYASLVAETGAPIFLERTERLPFWTFDIPPLLAFGLGVTWQAEGSDLAENKLQSDAELETLADPGFLTQDGFESEVLAAGTPITLSSDAISGARSLFVGEDDAVTFHLQRAGGSVLRFNRRQLDWVYRDQFYQAEWEFVRVRVGVVGGTKVIEQSLGSVQLAANSKDTPAPEEYEIPLTGEGDAVIVTFDLPPSDDLDCDGLTDCIAYPALIDDLRVE